MPKVFCFFENNTCVGVVEQFVTQHLKHIREGGMCVFNIWCLAACLLLLSMPTKAQNGALPWGTGTPPAWATTKEGIMNKMSNPDTTSFWTINAAAEAYLAAHLDEFEEGEEGEGSSFAVRHGRWYNFWSKQVAPDGNMSAIQQALEEIANNTDYVCSEGGEWTQLGPVVRTQHSGMIISVYSPPSHPEIIYAGSATAGLWKTEDGGDNWVCKTDGLRMPLLGVLSIVGHPTNPNEIIICTGTGNTSGHSNEMGIGVLRSTNGGNDWTPVSDLFHPAFYGEICRKIIRNPNNANELFAIMQRKVYKSTDNAATFTEVFDVGIPDVGSKKIYDIEILPGNNVIAICSMLIVGTSATASLYTSIDNGNTWSDCTNLPASAPRFHLASTLANPNTLYVGYYDSGNKILKLDFGTTPVTNCPLFVTPINVNGVLSTEQLNGFDRVFEVDPIYPNIVYYGCMGFYRSTNGGANFVLVPGGQPFYGGPSVTENDYHVDPRAMQISAISTTTSRLIMGNDGGVCVGIGNSELIPEFDNINDSNHDNNGDLDGINSLLVTQFYGIANCSERPNVVMGGTQDNTFFKYQNNTWLHLGNGAYPVSGGIGGDGGQTIISWDNPNIVYSRANQYICRSTNGGNSFEQGPSLEGQGLYDHTMVQDPQNPAIIHAAKATEYRKLQDNGTSLNNVATVYLGIGGARSIAVAPSDNSQIWIGVDDGLRHSTDGGLSFSAVLMYYQPNAIVIHPEDPNTIWIGNTGHDKDADGNGINRVLRSFDGGLTWTDMSLGLPYLPVLDLVYQQGSNGVLYAGTDIGVYRYDPTVGRWACYNKGLPVCMVTDLEIDYCRQVLHIGTFGRGIWESPLQIANAPRIIGANQNTIWEQNSYCLNDIIVEGGATLTIKATLKMGEDKKIVVKRGAKLIVDNGTITNTCGARWGGIEVWGNTAVAHKDLFNTDTPDGLTVEDYENLVLADNDPGMLILKNSATLQNGNINTIITNRSGGYFPNHYGGIVYGQGSFIINCRKGAAFMKYDYRNFSQFKGCLFSSNPSNSSNSPFEGISIWDCKGIKVDNCTFTYSTTPANTNRTGITAGEGLIVNNCQFENLSRGINLGASTYTDGSSSVTNSTFSNNGVAVLNMALNQLQFENNQVTNGTFGVFSAGNSQYTIKGNTFDGQTSVGIAALFNSQDTPNNNLIDCNTFTNCPRGNVCNGNNSGLQIINNTFDAQIADNAISGSIAFSQGDFNTPHFNLFSTNPATQHFKAPAGQTDLFVYFYHTDPLYTPEVNTRLVPKCDAASACTPVNNFIVTNTIPSAGWAYTGCLDLNGDGIAGMAAPNIDDCQTKECYYAAKAYLNNLKNEIDGGDKADLLNSLYNSPEALTTYQKYMAASPYLSDEVLITAAQTDLMSPNHRANILLSNAPLSDEAMYQIQDIVAPNVYQLLYTIKYYTKFSARDNLNLSISRESAKKEKLLHNLLQKFADEKDYAQLDEILTAENTTYAVRMLLSSKIKRGQYANAQAMLNYLPATNPDEQDYKTIQQINLQRLSATAEGFELSEEQYQQLRTIALAYGTQAPHAQTLLGLLRGEYFDWQLPEDDTESGKTDTHPRYKDVALLGKSVLNRLIATPNPANYTVNVQLPAYFTENSANLSLYDTHGKQLKSWTIDKEQANIDIHIDDLPNGVYIIQYTADGIVVAANKVVVQH